MTKEEILSNVRRGLQNFYEANKDRGILAIYIWGSILTDDFNPETSDIDTVAITDDKMPLQEEDNLRKSLASSWNGVVGFRILYLSELNGGAVKSNLSFYIPPQFLMLDFPYWLYVAGKKFTLNDLNLPKINFKEAINLQRNHTQKRHIKNIEAGNLEDYKYFSKALARLCYFMHCEKVGGHPFSYSSLLKNADDVTGPIVKAILEIRTKNWDLDIFRKRLPLLLNFLDSKYGK